jgi:prepilin-type N-terminal cleavage/methylation domain-containing protein
MKGRKGFTLVELMVVILIVGILAAVAIPIMRGRINSAKWSEGRAMMGTIGSSIRAYVAEKNTKASATGLVGNFSVWGSKLGFLDGDFTGAYFTKDSFAISSCDYDPNQAATPLTFVITGTNSNLNPSTLTLNQSGGWSW